METGAWHYAVTTRKRAAEFVAVLEQVLAAYPERPVLLALDNASIHTARTVRAWLADHPQIELLSLPANRLHGSLDDLVATVHAFFATFTPEDALRLAARSASEASLSRPASPWSFPRRELARISAATCIPCRTTFIRVMDVGKAGEDVLGEVDRLVLHPPGCQRAQRNVDCRHAAVGAPR